MAGEKIKMATDIYAYLMRHKMVSRKESILRFYYDDMHVYDIVHQIANSFGTIILEGRDKLQLIADGTESVFATSFTHLKEKYSDIENKKEFYLLCHILMIYLSEIDGELSLRSRYELQGLSLYRLEELVTNVFSFWKEQLEIDQDFEKRWAVNIREEIELWLSKDLKDEGNKLTASMRNKFSIMKKALSLLESESLLTVIVEGEEPTVYAYQELFERIEGLFHNYERYTMLRNALLEARSRKEVEMNDSHKQVSNRRFALQATNENL
ncbi:DUF6063 family protein [Sporosarcina luteola]|uniref:DUF6063 family protein n=1 Tax=Sporosarcina luteola TaxID=582850 RepID=UPI00203FEDDA|nr:DUF6063 family protein [Sporosarcina luteola]MCM3709109.1 DUF6063 family protein [Sporosarcina luteola]